MHVLMCMMIQEVAGMCVCRGGIQNIISKYGLFHSHSLREKCLNAL